MIEREGAVKRVNEIIERSNLRTSIKATSADFLTEEDAWRVRVKGRHSNRTVGSLCLARETGCVIRVSDNLNQYVHTRNKELELN